MARAYNAQCTPDFFGFNAAPFAPLTLRPFQSDSRFTQSPALSISSLMRRIFSTADRRASSQAISMFLRCALKFALATAPSVHIGQSIQFVAALEPLLKIEALSCDPAGIIPWGARSANIRPHGVDRASRANANVSQQSCTTITATSHAPSVLIHVHVRDPIEPIVAFQ